MRDVSCFFNHDFDVQTGSLTQAAEYIRTHQDIVAVIHLAAVVSPRNRAETFQTNVELTAQLAESCRQRSVPPTFIYMSSLAAAGPSAVDRARTESDPCSPRSIYGQSKHAAELVLSRYAKDVPISIVRPPGVFGPGDQNLLQLFRTVQKGWNLVGVSNRFKYCFIYIDDLTDGVLTVLNRGRRLIGAGDDPTSQGIYFVADPHAITFVELAEIVARSVGCASPRHITIPRWLCWPMASIFDVGGRVLNKKTFLNIDKMREAVSGNWTCDTSKIENELGFRVACDLNSRICQTATWYVDYGWIKKR